MLNINSYFGLFTQLANHLIYFIFSIYIHIFLFKRSWWSKAEICSYVFKIFFMVMELKFSGLYIFVPILRSFWSLLSTLHNFFFILMTTFSTNSIFLHRSLDIIRNTLEYINTKIKWCRKCTFLNLTKFPKNHNTIFNSNFHFSLMFLNIMFILWWQWLSFRKNISIRLSNI